MYEVRPGIKLSDVYLEPLIRPKIETKEKIGEPSFVSLNQLMR